MIFHKTILQIRNKPSILSDTDAAGILYAGLTAWSGLFISGQLGGLSAALTSQGGGGSGKKVCVLGGSGGVGNMAVQIAVAENAEVISTCSADAVPLLQSLGVRHIVDYASPDSNDMLKSYGP